MGRFKEIDTRVKELLEQIPETRENDQKLYIAYIETYYYIDFDKRVFADYKAYNLPPFSTVERSARDMRAKYPNLRGSKENQKNRKRLEAEYKTYYARKK